MAPCGVMGRVLGTEPKGNSTVRIRNNFALHLIMSLKETPLYPELHLPTPAHVPISFSVVRKLHCIRNNIYLHLLMKLHCIRNYIHLHLFVSFILRAVFIFIKDAVLFGGIGQQTYNDFEDKIWCKIVVTLYNYFIAANYFWLLVEGLFLHSLIAVGFFSERKYFRWYMVLGWGAPWLFMIPWIAVRVTLQDTRCWEIKHLQYWWIYRGPILVSVLESTVSYLGRDDIRAQVWTVIRLFPVLYPLTGTVWDTTTLALPATAGLFCGSCGRKLTRSTLVLIPLFGVHYIVFIGLPEDVTGQVKYVSYFFDTFMNSFQGMIVAVLYCFLNGEVQSELKRRWGLWRESRELGWERQSGLPTTTLSLVSRGSRDSPGNSPPRSPRISRVLPDSPVLLHYREYRVGDTTL
ncbi:Vasoactive intestinal polypeptide receptor [Branchiostoma belcheri]|nr:Vasoactive intestinal polypeptide receptor [Branchiostoma belcheri]